MNERVCLITGANRGIGLATAMGVAGRGYHVVMLCRNAGDGQRAVDRINATTGRSAASLLVADLASQAAVRDAAREFQERFERLDVLLNNAAAITHRRQTTPEGIELQFAVNHLAPFLLTRLLRDRLTGTAPARVVTVSSNAHFRARTLEFDNLQGERSYSGLSAYSRSKLANVLFTRELARKLDGTGVTANALHPGVVATGLLGGFFFLPKALSGLLRFMAVDTERGSATSIHAATSPDIAGATGKYLQDCKERYPSRLAQDDELARRLWQVSEELTGQRWAR